MLQRCRRQGSRFMNRKEYSRKIRYDTYSFSGKEWIVYGIESMGITILLGYFFYGSIFWASLLSPLIIVLLKRRKDGLCKKQKQELLNQFKEMLVSLNNAIGAGYSLENAFIETYKDMLYFYREDSLIVKELLHIRNGMRNGKTVEALMEDLGERSNTEDILDFANVLAIGKKSGGNINEIIRSGISVLEEKIETKQKIRTILSARTLEAKIMSIIPFFIILYISVSSKGYFDSLYRTLGGHIFMSVCLSVYLAAVYLSEKIVDIEI